MFTSCFPQTCCNLGVYLHRQITTPIPYKNQMSSISMKASKQLEDTPPGNVKVGLRFRPFISAFFALTICGHGVHYCTASDNTLCSGTASNEMWWALPPTTWNPLWIWPKDGFTTKILLCWDGTHVWNLSVGWSWQKDGLGWHLGSTMTNLIRELVPCVEYPYCC